MRINESKKRPVQPSAPSCGIVAMLVFAAALQGCMVGTDYAPPELASPPEFTRTDGIEKGDDAASLGMWWKGFGDEKLSELIFRALEANQDIDIALTRVNEARALAREARSQLYPGARLYTQYESQKTSGVRFSGNETEGEILEDGPRQQSTGFNYELWTAGVEASWEIDLFGRLRRGAESSEASLEAAERDVQDALRIVGAEVALTYVQLRSAQEQRRITLKNIELQRQTLELVQAKFDAGAVSELDLQRSRTQVSATRAELPLIDVAEKTAVHRLSVLLAKPPAELRAELLEEKPIPKFQGPAHIASPASLLKRRPDLRSAERRLHAAIAKSGSIEAELYPRMEIVGTVAIEATSPDEWFDGGSTVYSIVPKLLWTPLDNGSIRARIAAQDARAERALIEYEKALLVALEETENALANFGAQRARWNDLVASVEASEKAFSLARIQYESGATDLLTVVDAQRVLLVQRSALAKSETELASSLVGIYRALGGGWEDYQLAPETTAQKG